MPIYLRGHVASQAWPRASRARFNDRLQKFLDIAADDGDAAGDLTGVVASAAAGWRLGEAKALELHARRTSNQATPTRRSFAIAAAIKVCGAPRPS